MSELKASPLTQPSVTVAEESWSSLWPDAYNLAEAHSSEVDSGVEPRRKWKPDTELMALMNRQGSFRVFGARDQDGKLVGYISWTVTLDPESLGLLIALMGPWYAEPSSHCGGKLYDTSAEVLRRAGVQCLFPHHRTQGRGAKLGPFFLHRGAKLIQHNYIHWIAEDGANVSG